MRHRVTVLALGSRGDVQPFVPLGQALQRAGHRVRVATFSAFAPLIQGADLEFFPLPGDAEVLLRRAAQGDALFGRSPIAGIQALARSYGTLARSLPTVIAGLGDTDLVLNQLPSFLFGGDLAEHLGVPWAVVAVIPIIRTRYRPLVGFPQGPGWLPGYNQLTYRLGEQVGWQLFRGAVNRLRKRWGLAPHPPWGAIGALYRQGVPFICGFSAHVVPRPPDWGPQVHLTGWWYPEEPDWEPPEQLQHFLAAGPAPVFIGFGSMPVADPQQVTALVVEAVRRSGQRAILHVGWARLGGHLPSEIFPLEYAPYGWLFPRMSGIVHHSGSGTTGFALRSGVPSLVVPFAFDQPYWGERTAVLRAGLPPLPYRELEAGRLATALRQLAGEPDLRAGGGGARAEASG
ncbi:MAG: glycosyltransferase family 1 protein [Chloroflexales bacterium]|nr:glycosyltransferase family 1 protein [Chloroflexales bacterium]